MTIPAPDIFARIYARHGHRCPMSTLGGRLGLAALKILGPGEPDEMLTAVYLTRTCAVDGIAETTGLTEQAGTLTIEPAGRHALRVTRDWRILELELSPAAMQQAGSYRKLCYELEAGWDELDSEERERREEHKQLFLDEMLPGLWRAADDELILVREDNGA